MDRADVVVLDPPRKGCEPAVLERLAALGYGTTAVQPLDLFPGTAHVECLAALTDLRRRGP